MEISFAAQPWADGTNLDDFVAAAATSAALSPLHLLIVTAWAKRSGLSRVREDIALIRRSGGSVEIVVGVSEGGATRQGLELALELADRVDVFHDAGGRTFHPKVYLAAGVSNDALWVGSNNLTAGGLFSNYEAALTLRVPATPEHDVVGQVRRWVARLRADEECCKPLTPNSLTLLAQDPRYRIGDEDYRAAATLVDLEEGDSVVDDSRGESLFGRSRTQKRGPRRQPARRRPVVDAPEQAPKQPGDSSGSASGAVLARWSKLMKRSDAQQTPAGTQPTGALRLGASGHSIDHRTYFRRVFFDREPWRVDPGNAATEIAELL